MDKSTHGTSIDNPASSIRFEPSTVQKFNNSVLNTAGNVEPYSQERPMDSSLKNSSAASTNPVATSGNSYAPSSQFPEPVDETLKRHDQLAHDPSASFGASASSGSSSGGFFDRIKDKVSDLMHGHSDQDMHSAFPTHGGSHNASIIGDSRVEKSDTSNARTGGSWLSKDKSHSDTGDLPFALDKDVDRTQGASDLSSSSSGSSGSSGFSLGNAVRELIGGGSHDVGSSSDLASTTSVPAPATTATGVPHPAAENVSDFSFWQPPADAPVTKGGFSAPGSDNDPLAFKDNVSETARHAAAWEGK